MRSSGGTNFWPDASVVVRTKSRIACFAGPSFHDGSAAVDVAVCADAETDKNRAHIAGRSAKVEMRARRPMSVDGSIGFIVSISRALINAPINIAGLQRPLCDSHICLFQ